MPDRDFEMQQLRLADHHIERAKQIILDQELELRRLRLKGYDTELTEKTLEVFEDSLRAMYQHRDLIIRIIDQIDRGWFSEQPPIWPRGNQMDYQQRCHRE